MWHTCTSFTCSLAWVARSFSLLNIFSHFSQLKLIWVYICHVCFWFFLNIIHCLSIWFNQGFFFKKCFSTFQTLKLFIEETFRCHLSCFFCALLSENCFSQCSHLYGSSPVWTLSCFFKTDNWPNSLLQNEQLYGKVPQTTRVLYSFMMNINMLV